MIISKTAVTVRVTTRRINGLGSRCSRCKLSSRADEDVPFVSLRTHRLPAISISAWYDRLFRCIVSTFIRPSRVWTRNCREQQREGGETTTGEIRSSCVSLKQFVMWHQGGVGKKKRWKHNSGKFDGRQIMCVNNCETPMEKSEWGTVFRLIKSSSWLGNEERKVCSEFPTTSLEMPFQCFTVSVERNKSLISLAWQKKMEN